MHPNCTSVGVRIHCVIGVSQVVSRLGGTLPVFINATEGTEWEETAEALDDLFLGDAEIWSVHQECVAERYLLQRSDRVWMFKALASAVHAIVCVV